jgi:phosphatidate cytidylyltransferase
MSQTHSRSQPSELTLRILTALFGVAAFLSVLIWGGPWGAVGVATLLSLGGMIEFVGMTFRLSDKEQKRFLLLFVSVLVCLMSAIWPESRFDFLIAVFIFVFGFFLFSARRHPEVELSAHMHELMFAVFGLIYLVYLPLFLPMIRTIEPLGLEWTILFFLTVWSADTGAYFAGRTFGRRKLYPLISPKKTLEGLVGGVLTALVVTGIFWKMMLPSETFGIWLAASLSVALVSQVGDLCESFLKRSFDKKDSGKILPGHGGFLDRFDGVIFSLPVMYACLRASL